MKPAQPVILLVHETLWRIGVRTPHVPTTRWIDVAAPQPANPETLAASIAKALTTLHYAGDPLVLAIPAAWCLAAAVSTADLPRGKKARHQALRYRLEERLPLAAEEFVASYCPAPHSPMTSTTSPHSVPSTSVPVSSATEQAPASINLGAPIVDAEDPISANSEVLAVAVAIERLAPVVQALEAQGIAIGPICPTTFLAVQTYAGRLPKQVRIFWEIEEHLETLVLQGGVPKNWTILKSDVSAVQRHLALAALQENTSLPCEFLDSSLATESLKRISSAPKAAVQPAVEGGCGAADWAAQAAEQVLAGSLAPWIDLRCDAMATQDRCRMFRRPLNTALAAAAVLAVCLTVGLAWQAHRYTLATADLQGRQEAIYRRLYPGSPMPQGVHARLQSEALRLRAISGQSADLPRQGSALLTIYDVLRRLPTDVRYRILDMRFGPTEFVLEGQSKSHGDADAIATGLRRQNGFVVEPTRTEQLSTGQIAFTIAGKTLPPVTETLEKKR